MKEFKVYKVSIGAGGQSFASRNSSETSWNFAASQLFELPKGLLWSLFNIPLLVAANIFALHCALFYRVFDEVKKAYPQDIFSSKRFSQNLSAKS